MVTGFDAKADKFDVPEETPVAGINAAVSGKLGEGSFDADLAGALNAHHLSALHAAVFHATSGSLKGETFLVIDANGIAGYQASQDYVIALHGALHLSDLSKADFTTHSIG
jgi:hypothetical protein